MMIYAERLNYMVQRIVMLVAQDSSCSYICIYKEFVIFFRYIGENAIKTQVYLL